MIFDRFFTPAYRSEKPEARIKAIATLSPDKPQEKTILHELAFNDADSDVTLAALHRLNSFALWQKITKTGFTERVRREAEKQVEGILKGDIAVSISDAERRAFLKESANTALIGELLLSDPGLHDDPAFVLGLLSRAGDSTLSQQVFLSTSNQSLQHAIIEATDDLELLTRLQRKTRDKDLQTRLAERIEARVAAQQKPLQLKKAITLCLSKYQALLEKDDYPEVADKQARLESEYQTLMADKTCLSSEDADGIEEKYTRIHAQIQRHCERLKPLWQAAESERQIEQTLVQAETQKSQLQDALSNLFDEKLLTATDAELQAIDQAIVQFADTLEKLVSLAPTHSQLPALRERHQCLAAQFAQFGQQRQYGEAALRTLEQADAFFRSVDTEHDVPDETQATATGFQQQWQAHSAELAKVPSVWRTRWQTLWSDWCKRLKAQKAALEAKHKAVRKQLNIIDSQIDNGRFRAAMKGFEAVRPEYLSLSGEARQSLAKRFEQTQAAVERLEGWQSYLAAPRKPAILEEARALAGQLPDDIAKRAETIRYLREQWKSLGTTGDKQDEAHNVQFDAYLEAAFAPCRDHYAAQEQRREEALKERQALIAQAEQLSDIDDLAVLARTLEKMSEQWHGAGQLDAKRYRKLKTRWDKAIGPHKQRVNDWYQQNREAKQALIREASALADSDDLDAAAGQAQLLQQRWKQTGHAGRRAESSLWHNFKQANDALFARVKDQRRSARDAQQQSATELKQKLDELIGRIGTDNPQDIRREAARLDAESRSLGGSLKRALHKKFGELNKRLDDKECEKQQALAQARYQALLVLLDNWHQGDADTCLDAHSYAALGKHWQQACESSQPSAYTRSWLTTALEIHTSSPSPSQAAEERQAVQLELLSAKLAQGEKWSFDQLIGHWLRAGVITSTEKPLADRVADVVSGRLESTR